MFATHADSALRSRTGTLILNAMGDQGIEMSVSNQTGIATTSPSANLSVNGNVYATGSISALDAYVTGSANINAAMNMDAAISFNDAGAATDYRIEGDTDPNLLYIDGSADSVGIGTSSPSQALHVVGNAVASGNVVATYLAPTSQLLILDGTASKHPIDYNPVPGYSFYLNSGNIYFAPNGTALFNLSSGNLFLENTDLRTDRWTDDEQATFIGASVAGNNNLDATGLRNTALGYWALHKQSTADDTVAIGAHVFASQSTLGRNVGVGAYTGSVVNAEYRTLVGYYVSGNNTNSTGDGQTAFGYAAQAKTSGHGANSSVAGSYSGYSDIDTQIAALGSHAAYNRIDGNMVAAGYETGYNVKDLSAATHIGSLAGRGTSLVSSSLSSTAIGYAAGYTSGGNLSTLIGANAGYTIGSTYQRVVAIGSESQYNNSGKSDVTSIGYGALYSQSSGDAENTAIGYLADYNNNNAAMTTIGFGSAWQAGGATSNSIFGANVLGASTTGGSSVFVGSDSARHTDTNNPAYMVAIGSRSAYHKSVLYNNGHSTGIGFEALKGVVSTNYANKNLCIGTQTGISLDTGDYNIALGYRAGDAISDGQYNSLFGVDQAALSPASGYYVNFGGVIHADTTNNKVSIGTTTFSSALAVQGDLAISGNLYISGSSLTFNSNVTLNDLSASADFRVEGDTNTHAFYIKGSSDNVGVGTSTPMAALDVAGNVSFKDSLYLSGNLMPNRHMTHDLGSTSKYFLNVYSQMYLTVSDRRHKENIGKLHVGKDEVMKLRPVSYRLHSEPRKSYGLIAQEVIDILPEVVRVASDKAETHSLNYDHLITLMVQAIQDQNKAQKIEWEEGLKRIENVKEDFRCRAKVFLATQKQEYSAKEDALKEIIKTKKRKLAILRRER
ncbi:MAG: tail fiber domain-containing protein [Planctomycetes bacterium]|nr:tail fiber domain-containing protein [Planctomycetota bacterium]